MNLQKKAAVGAFVLAGLTGCTADVRFESKRAASSAPSAAPKPAAKNDTVIEATTLDGFVLSSEMLVKNRPVSGLSAAEAEGKARTAFKTVIGRGRLTSFFGERMLETTLEDLKTFPDTKKIVFETNPLFIEADVVHEITRQLAHTRYKDGVLTETQDDPVSIDLRKLTTTLSPDDVRKITGPAAPKP